ncbi:MAG: gamma-glutamylcyclotransferase [Myxococcota bacterium]
MTREHARRMWIFGYGSLIWRPDFEFVERREGYIRGWKRRFWQGSPDHRGVVGAPGRVVTLLPDPEARCWGIAYRIAGAEADRILEALDARERAGYERHEVRVHGRDPEARIARALVYVATERNPNFLGPSRAEVMAAHIVRSRGRSGTNSEYLLKLAEALRRMGVRDPHVEELEALVAAASCSRWPRAKASSRKGPEDTEKMK